MTYNVGDLSLFKRGQNLCVSMNVSVPYGGKYIPFYIECRTFMGEDGIYYAVPEEKTLGYISDEHIRNNVRETARIEGTEFINSDKEDFLY